MIKRLLVPIDFSTPSLKALDYAVEFAKPFKPEFVLLHVLEPLYYPGPGAMDGGFDMGLVFQEIERAGREQLSHATTRLKRRGLRVRSLLLAGSASQVIVETAKKLHADLIVMATHGRTGLSHVLIGSVAERVVREASCPVLTIRATEGSQSGGRSGPHR